MLAPYEGEDKAAGRGAGGGPDRPPLTRASNRRAPTRRNRPAARQQRLKALARAAGAGILAAELLDQLLLSAADEAQAALHPGLGRIALTPLGGDLESRGGRRDRRSSFRPPVGWAARDAAGSRGGGRSKGGGSPPLPLDPPPSPSRSRPIRPSSAPPAHPLRSPREAGRWTLRRAGTGSRRRTGG